MLKNKKILITLIIVLVISISGGLGFVINFIVNRNNPDENQIFVNDVSQELTVDSEDDIDFTNDENQIGTLEIPKLELVAPIKEGIDQETLAKYIGHFTNSNIWDGNVALASHNRGSEVKHYFDRINELQKEDKIIYKTKLGERSYKVTQIKEIENTDWSDTEGNTNNKNMITMITCITNNPDKRLCVIAEEI